MKKIEKYTDPNGVSSSAILSNGEQLLMSASSNNKVSLEDFVEALVNGTWEGGYVDGFNGYIASDTFTRKGEDSKYIIFGKPDFSDFLIMPDPSTINESERFLYLYASGSSVENNVYADMSRLEDIKKTEIGFDVHMNSLDFRLEGYFITFADVITLSLQAVAPTGNLLGNYTFHAYLTIPDTSISIPAGSISLKDLREGNPIHLNATFNIPDWCNVVNLSLQTSTPSHTVWGPEPIISI